MNTALDDSLPTYQDFNQYNNFAGWLTATEDYDMIGECELLGVGVQLELPLGGGECDVRQRLGVGANPFERVVRS